MESVTKNLYDVLELARGELVAIGMQRPHLANFCASLVGFVVTGKGLPNGAATKEARQIVVDAVRVSLKKTFGDDYANDSSDAVKAVMMRLATLGG